MASPTAIMKSFLRACGHTEALIWTVGDVKQAAHFESSRCSNCRERTMPKFGRGRMSSR